MADSNFPFIKDAVLRQNIDQAFDHIVTLAPFENSDTYNEAAKSSFRKTMIIYTASILEGFLYYILDNKFTGDEVRDFHSSWKLTNKTVLHTVVEGEHEIVAGDYKKCLGEEGKKMNLAQIANFLKKKEVISNSLYVKIDKVRVLRNEQHICAHTEVKSYTSLDLEKSFATVKEVKDIVEKIK